MHPLLAGGDERMHIALIEPQSGERSAPIKNTFLNNSIRIQKASCYY